MSVLVKGMEMPQSCMNCMFCGFAGADCELDTCLITGNAQKHIPYSKMPDCPLADVSEDMDIVDLACWYDENILYPKRIREGRT